MPGSVKRNPPAKRVARRVPAISDRSRRKWAALLRIVNHSSVDSIRIETTSGIHKSSAPGTVRLGPAPRADFLICSCVIAG